MARTLGNILIILFVAVTIYALRDDVLPVAYKVFDYAEIMLGYQPTNFGASDIMPISQPPQGTTNTASNNSGAIGAVNAPGPLQVTVPNVTVSDLSISRDEIVRITNVERAQNGGLSPLSENKILDQMAEAKAADMLAKQYFEHTSPSGVTVSMQAKNFGYDYIILGENLALGNFANAQAILDAWMKSPGHRANILKPQYAEIGVGIVKGYYKGQYVWFAVQHFGTPRSACPEVDMTLKAQIDAGEEGITGLKTEIDAKVAQINQTDKYSPEYTTLVDEYNSMVRTYNDQILAIKAQIAVYNGEVTAFNTCASGTRG